MPNFYIVRTKTDRIVLGVSTTKYQANKLRDSWSDFYDGIETVDILPCDSVIAASAPRYRIFRVYTNPNGVVPNNTFSHGLRFINDPIPNGRDLGVVHVEDLVNGRYSADVYLRGSDFFNLGELQVEAERLIDEAIRSYDDDVRKPAEQRVPTEDVILQWMTERIGSAFTITSVLNGLGNKHGFTQSEIFIALAKLTTSEKIIMSGDIVYGVTGSNTPDTQDQCSSFDGEVIL